MTDIFGRFEKAQSIARAAGALALEYFRNRAVLTVEMKGLQDVVSIADRAVEDLIREKIGESFPDDAILGEEGGGDVDIDGPAPIWVVDPIDGTQPFLSGVPTWCISIALVSEGEIRFGVIYDPCFDEMFAGGPGFGMTCNGETVRPSDASALSDGMLEVGFSNRVTPALTLRVFDKMLQAGGMFHRSGSGALSLAYVAAGRFIGYFEEHMNSWDSLAGVAMVRAGGGWTNDVLADNGLIEGAMVVASGAKLAPVMRGLAEMPAEGGDD